MLPIGVKRLQGSELKPKLGAQCPACLSDRAKLEWRRLAPGLEKLGFLTILDQSIFGIFCETVSMYEETKAAVEKAGPGERIPATITMEKAAKEMWAYAGMFGLCPKDKTGLNVVPGADTYDEAS